MLTLSTFLGVMGSIQTFLLFWFVETVLQLPRETMWTVILLGGPLTKSAVAESPPL